MRRPLVVTALIYAAFFATARPSLAATPTCAISLVDPSPAAGEVVILNGSNLPTTPSSVAILIDRAPGATRQLGRALVAPDGSFAEPVHIPADTALGTHTITAACGTTTINVVQPSVPAKVDDNDDATAIAAAGVAAIVIALVLTTRRRRAQRIPA